MQKRPEKLLRPLHRQRVRRHPRAQVLDSAELCAYFGVPRQHLLATLAEQGIAYHSDSQGEVWASVPIQP